MPDNFQFITGSHFMGVGGFLPLPRWPICSMIAAKSGKFYTILNIVFSLNKQVLPKIL